MKWRKAVPVLFLASLLAFVGYPWGDQPAQAQSFVPGPSWTCSLDAIGATLTRCALAPTGGDSGTKRFVTDIVAQSTTATAGQFILRTGTGTNCGTGTVSLFPSAATVIRFSAPGNGSAPTVISFRTPLEVPKDSDLCLLGVGTNTVTAQISGYLGF